MANSFRNDTYRSAKTLAYIVMALFGGIALCSAFYIVMSFVMLAFPDTEMSLGDGDSINIWFGLIGLASILEVFLRLAVIVFFLIWEYRSFNNLSALRARNLEFSPGWAVGWWFIPFANLIKPFQAIRELWNESDPDFDEETGFLQTAAGTPELIGFWWAAFLISGFVGRITDKLVSAGGEPSQYFPVFLLIGSILQLAASILIILIVKGVTERQERRFDKIAAGGQFAPPPPAFYQDRQT
ncbi:MAG TPA: DUF4328 domain-containing protein [Pyrinomonadaceae bacterium]|jgi:hypothetical protein